MKRRLLIIAVFLLLGAVLNVAVAWGCALLAPGTDTFERYSGVVDSRLSPLVGDADLVLWGATGYSGYGYDVVETTVRPLVESGWQYSSVAIVTGEAGLPLRSVYGHFIARGEFAPRRVCSLAAPWPFAGDPLSFLPFHPTWPAFAINTLLYAAILWLLAGGPSALRRFLRVRRGLCPKCAYPMGESAVCTECGKPLPSSPTVA